MGDKDHDSEGITPAEFTKRMPEGESAGPGAPETIETHRGSDAPDTGPGGPASKGIGEKGSDDEAGS